MKQTLSSAHRCDKLVEKWIESFVADKLREFLMYSDF
jgi:hypothetical protein